jgi:hypothetical protein
MPDRRLSQEYFLCEIDESGSIVFDDSTYLLFMSQSRQADLHLINRSFTAVSQVNTFT